MSAAVGRSAMSLSRSRCMRRSAKGPGAPLGCRSTRCAGWRSTPGTVRAGSPTRVSSTASARWGAPAPSPSTPAGTQLPATGWIQPWTDPHPRQGEHAGQPPPSGDDRGLTIRSRHRPAREHQRARPLDSDPQPCRPRAPHADILAPEFTASGSRPATRRPRRRCGSRPAAAREYHLAAVVRVDADQLVPDEVDGLRRLLFLRRR